MILLKCHQQQCSLMFISQTLSDISTTFYQKVAFFLSLLFRRKWFACENSCSLVLTFGNGMVTAHTHTQFIFFYKNVNFSIEKNKIQTFSPIFVFSIPKWTDFCSQFIFYSTECVAWGPNENGCMCVCVCVCRVQSGVEKDKCIANRHRNYKRFCQHTTLYSSI